MYVANNSSTGTPTLAAAGVTNTNSQAPILYDMNTSATQVDQQQQLQAYNQIQSKLTLQLLSSSLEQIASSIRYACFLSSVA